MNIEGWILALGFLFGFLAGVRDVLSDYRGLDWGAFA